jgi:hypothetical protein
LLLLAKCHSAHQYQEPNQQPDSLLPLRYVHKPIHDHNLKMFCI